MSLEVGIIGGLVEALAPVADPEDVQAAVEAWLDDNPTAVTPIDDTAGIGDTDKLWSAGKTASEVATLTNAITKISDTMPSKNMVDYSVLDDASGITENDGVYTGIADNFKMVNMGALLEDEFEPGTQYTLSLYAYTNGAKGTDGNGLYPRIEHTDGTFKSIEIPNSTSSFTRFSTTSTAGKTIKRIYFSNVKYYNQVWNVKQIQIEKGTSATAYVSPDSGEPTAKDQKARNAIAKQFIRPWYAAFEEEPLRIAYSAIWVDKINTATHWLFAADMGFNVLKGDVEITSDNKLIMCHDPGFTFDGNGRITAYDESNNTTIVSMTYATARGYVYADNPTRYGDYCPVADIDDFLGICKEKGKIAFVTIRGTNTATVVDVLADAIIKHGMESRVIINALSSSLLETVRANHKCDNIAMNYIADIDTAITNANVDTCVSLGRCFLSVWCNSSTTVVDNSASAIAYAHQKGVPVLAGSIGTVEMWNYLLSHGIVGSQIYKPLFDVEPKNYRFTVVMDDGTPTFGNKFASDRYTGTVSLSGTTLSVSAIKVTGSPLTNVIDGIQPIKMNMLDPVIRCFDQSGNTIPCVWSNNALVLTLSNTNDNTYTVIVTV